MTLEKCSPSRFESIFFKDSRAIPITVPDYQRSYSWEDQQIELFISDLIQHLGTKSYYFGHFIVEENQERNEHQWEVVDGQQRLTTVVLFLMVCRHLDNCSAETSAHSLVEHFKTVSYDRDAFALIYQNLATLLKSGIPFTPKKPPSDQQIMKAVGITENFTHSQRRMVLALLRFQYAFNKGNELNRNQIPGYTKVVMQAHCSCHVTDDKSVAVNIFEMHNTRGVPLSTLEILKAKLMQSVYSTGGEELDEKVRQIQDEFGEIYAMEERLATKSFRGEMTMDNLIRQHLRVVDDGNKTTAKEYKSPPTNANAEELIKYVDEQLKDADSSYALNLAKELRESVRIMTKTIPEWDTKNPLVGDVMILERELSCEWFLLICRRLQHVSKQLLSKWEILLFTRNFHDKYHGLWYKDNFPELFAALEKDEEQILSVIERYIKDGFRAGHTDDLQAIVRKYLEENESSVINRAYYWWKDKMIYALYKYETSSGANIREVMKGTISVEHILPQDWQWIKEEDANLLEKTEEEWNQFKEGINSIINGAGNLLLIKPGENTQASNKHPKDKYYNPRYSRGSYQLHDENRMTWGKSSNWDDTIRERGNLIHKFILEHLIDPNNTADHKDS